MYKRKSYYDVVRQFAYIVDTYGTENEHYPRAKAISKHYLDMIGKHFARLGDATNRLNYREEKLPHEYRSFMPDTSLEKIADLKPRKVKGLFFFDREGNKLTPINFYFGCDTRLWREDGETCGRCFTHYDNALLPVYLPDGARFIWQPLANVSCRYKDGTIYDYHRQ